VGKRIWVWALVGSALLVAFLYGISGRSAPGSAPGDPPPTTRALRVEDHGAIALVGDSLSAQATVQEIARLKAAGWGPIVVNALSGRRVPPDSPLPPSSGISAVKTVRGAGNYPDTWIVELGTNDVSKIGNDAPAMRSVIKLMLAEIGPGHRIIWINVHNGLDLVSSATFNRVLAQVAAQRTDMVIGDWASTATRGEYLVPDGTHLTVAGIEAFAELIAATATSAAS
jgi:lysophospholipase L1-like esterase